MRPPDLEAVLGPEKCPACGRDRDPATEPQIIKSSDIGPGKPPLCILCGRLKRPAGEVANVRILETQLGFEDHGAFWACIMVEGDGWGQGFGCRILGEGFTHRFVFRTLEALGLSRWEALPGLVCRVIRPERHNDPLVAIGHAVQERWFVPEWDLERSCPRCLEAR